MQANNPIRQPLPLTHLQDRASDPEKQAQTPEEINAQRIMQEALIQAEEIIVILGGKAGRLGETIVGTGLLEGLLHALRITSRTCTPVRILIDPGVTELFDAQAYQESYWSAITTDILTSSLQEGIETVLATKKDVLLLDFHGEHDGPPALEIIQGLEDRTTEPDYGKAQRIVIARQLFRTGIRGYAQHGPERRYADFIENLFYLPEGSIDGKLAQPTIRIKDPHARRYQYLTERYQLHPEALLIICFFQSVVLAKCYGLWDEILQRICDYQAEHNRDQKLDFFIACGPDNELPEGFHKQDIEAWLADCTGNTQNTRVLIHKTESLRDLAIIAQRATLALSNDTGPGHISGALHIPTIVPYLPGSIYSQQVWSSTLWHRGTTVVPNPYSYQQIANAVTWGNTDIINSIPVDTLYREIQSYLPNKES